MAYGVLVPSPTLPLPSNVKNGVDDALLPFVEANALVVVAGLMEKIDAVVPKVVVAVVKLAPPVTLSEPPTVKPPLNVPSCAKRLLRSERVPASIPPASRLWIYAPPRSIVTRAPVPWVAAYA